MFCNKCGFQFEGNFCPKCGAVAKGVPVQETEPKNTNTTQVDTDVNPYDVYYNQPTYYTPPQPQSAVNQGANTETQEQNVNVGNSVRQSAEPYYQQVQQPVYQTPPPYYQQPRKENKSLTWWQITLIVIACFFLYGFSSFIIPASCTCSMIACDEAFINEIDKLEEIENRKSAFVGETVNSECFSYTVTDAKYIEEYENKKPKDGHRFVEVTIKAVNTSDVSEWLEYEVHCYANNNLYVEANDEYYYDFGNLLPMKSCTNTVVYEVPENASVEIYLDDYSSNIIFMLNDLN